MTPAGVLRRLSGTEAACAYRHALTGGQTQAATRLTVAAVFSPAYVERAVARWARGFRALSLRIVEDGGSLWFHEVPGFAPDQLRQEMCTAAVPGPGGVGAGDVTSFGADDARTFGAGDGLTSGSRPGVGLMSASRAGDCPMSGAGDVLTAGGPLWRLGVGHDPAAAETHLLLTCHPALCDGPSTARLLRALLDALLGEGPADRGRPGYRQDSAPDADELTYRPPPPPYLGTGPGPIPALRAPLGLRAVGPKRLTPVPGAPVSSGLGPVLGSAGTVVEAVGAESVAPMALTARQSARLTAWCRRHRITAGEFFAAALADSCARAVGQEEVALLTAVSLRRRYAECVRVSEVGCFVDVVRATVRAGDGGALADRARAYGLAVREADAAWHPVRQDHARIRRAVEAETAAAVAGGGLGFRVTQEGCADTALGHHAALVTRYGTTPYGTLAPGSVSHGLASYEAEFGTTPWRTPSYATASRKAVHGTSPYEVMHGTGPHGPGHGTSGYGTPYSSSPGTAVHGAAPRPFGVLHLSRFKGALTLSLGMPDPPEMRTRAGASTGNGGLNAPEIAAELTARALDLVA
ncbi:hypothetical protein ACFVU0_15215 [Streptomyces sp. NPDC058122]|uniref:hypothetical protein n=1 Tax=Streptomyces sp. NPDC058122 TaxID=3346349 RepID=UPI0036E4CF57